MPLPPRRQPVIDVNEAEWVPVRPLAREWSVDRMWLSGFVAGTQFPTRRGRHNEILVHRDHLSLIHQRVKLSIIVGSG